MLKQFKWTDRVGQTLESPSNFPVGLNIAISFHRSIPEKLTWNLSKFRLTTRFQDFRVQSVKKVEINQ